MQLLNPAIRKDLFTPERPVRAKGSDRAPSYVGAGGRCVNSMMAENSVLCTGVVVEPGAVVRNCVLFKGTVVRRNAQLSYVITDKKVEILPDRTLMGHSTYPIVLAKGSRV